MLILWHIPLDCQDALGMETGGITDGQITASSAWNAVHAPFYARLHFQATTGKAGSWSAGSNDVNQWLQIDLVQKMTVTRVALAQGRNCSICYQYVRKYKLQYGFNGEDFQYYREQGKSVDKVKTEKIYFKYTSHPGSNIFKKSCPVT